MKEITLNSLFGPPLPPESAMNVMSSFLTSNMVEASFLQAGYVMDKEMGNTGGLGGVFGLVYAGAFLRFNVWLYDLGDLA